MKAASRLPQPCHEAAGSTGAGIALSLLLLEFMLFSHLKPPNIPLLWLVTFCRWEN